LEDVKLEKKQRVNQIIKIEFRPITLATSVFIYK